jgi:hypothetical protein
MSVVIRTIPTRLFLLTVTQSSQHSLNPTDMMTLTSSDCINFESPVAAAALSEYVLQACCAHGGRETVTTDSSRRVSCRLHLALIFSMYRRALSERSSTFSCLTLKNPWMIFRPPFQASTFNGVCAYEYECVNNKSTLVLDFTPTYRIQDWSLFLPTHAFSYFCTARGSGLVPGVHVGSRHVPRYGLWGRDGVTRHGDQAVTQLVQPQDHLSDPKQESRWGTYYNACLSCVHAGCIDRSSPTTDPNLYSYENIPVDESSLVPGAADLCMMLCHTWWYRVPSRTRVDSYSRLTRRRGRRREQEASSWPSVFWSRFYLIFSFR